MRIISGSFKGKKITFHDPCYLGRANDVYEAPRQLIEKLDAELVEMKRCKTPFLLKKISAGRRKRERLKYICLKVIPFNALLGHLLEKLDGKFKDGLN